MTDNKHVCGALREPTPIRNYKFDLACGYTPRADLPDSYTIPEDTIPPVHDQGGTSSCVAFAMAAATESELLRGGNAAPCSTGWNYGRRESRGDYEGKGLFVSRALKGAVKIGFVPEHYFNFTNDVPQIIALAAERDDLLPLGGKNKPASYVAFEYALKDRLWDSIRAAFLDFNHPLVIYSADFYGDGHAVIAYGFTTRNGARYLKIQNSWGKSWGKNGRGEIPIEYVDGAYLFLWEDISLPFDDVKKRNWFYNDVKAAYLAGFINGTSETQFAPNDNIIRGDVAVIIDRLLTSVEQSANIFGRSKQQAGEKCGAVAFAEAEDAPFADIAEGDYYYKAICRIFVNKIIVGKSYNLFAPNDTITRAEMAAMAVRTLGIIEAKLITAFNKKCGIAIVSAKDFKDVTLDKWYYNYVRTACKYGVICGCDDGTFKPDNPITRAEAAAIFNRMFRSVDKLLQQLV